MKMGLLGFVTDDANKGCEALTYSFVQLLKQTIQVPFEIVCYLPVEGRSNKLQNYFKDLKITEKRLKIKDVHLSALRELRSCDFVFDVTCGDGFSDIYFPKQAVYTTLLKELVIIAGTSLILLPQTYGPFSDRRIERFAMHVINKSRRVYSRDLMSTNYIHQHLKHKDVLTVTDLAFFLPYDSSKYSVEEDKTNVGINVSGLLWNGGFTDKNQFGLSVNYQEYICGVIETLHSIGCAVHLIPHVIENENDSIDGDVRAGSALKERYPYLIQYPKFQNPIDAKSYISKMDVFTGARMHSTIAAISAGIPVIPFSYSRKFEGLYESLQYNYLIHGKHDETKQAVEQTIAFVKNRATLQHGVDMSRRIINEQLQIFCRDIEQILGV